jgi:hypothetical protein
MRSGGSRRPAPRSQRESSHSVRVFSTNWLRQGSRHAPSFPYVDGCVTVTWVWVARSSLLPTNPLITSSLRRGSVLSEESRLSLPSFHCDNPASGSSRAGRLSILCPDMGIVPAVTWRGFLPGAAPPFPLASCTSRRWSIGNLQASWPVARLAPWWGQDTTG